jgi:hypothetical protein
MKLRYVAVAVVAMMPALWVGCDEVPNGCEEAKQSIEDLLRTSICSEPPYVNSPFCVCCVANGFYAMDADCTCRALEFDVSACYYAKDEQAKPQARAAVEYANQLCTDRTVNVPYLDGATGQCVSASASSSSSSSGGGAVTPDAGM